MKKLFNLFLFSTALFACGQPEAKSVINLEPEEKPSYQVETFQYDSLTIPLFFEALTKNHQKDFYLIDSLEFNQFCSLHSLDQTDTINIEEYFKIKILHEIFTSQAASNCSRGEIINIPYQWHWVESNPRHEIYFASSNKLLKDTKPPKEFSKYSSYADIDRTPYLYLSDLVAEVPKYYSELCGSFSTFGWCSEREMAFVALAKLLKFEGKVGTYGNHSWSEFIVPLKRNNGEVQIFLVHVDNTFDRLDWTTIDQEALPDWKKDLGSTSLSVWYNRKAKSDSELRSIESHVVSPQFMSRMESDVVEYLTKRINGG